MHYFGVPSITRRVVHQCVGLNEEGNRDCSSTLRERVLYEFYILCAVPLFYHGGLCLYNKGDEEERRFNRHTNAGMSGFSQ
jgi:hypothetical protein